MNPMDHAAVMNSCDAKAERVGLSALSEVERVVVLVNRVNFEVIQGGLTTFFYNSAGNHAAETVPALVAVGADKAATALQSAMALFPGGSPPADRDERYDGWRAVSGSLAPFDDPFTEKGIDVFDLLCSYIEAHAVELREHM